MNLYNFRKHSLLGNRSNSTRSDTNFLKNPYSFYAINTNDEKFSVLKLKEIHKKLKIKYGSFIQEFPEQVMACMFIKPDDVVLEIGGNIGRNSLIISELLDDDSNLVTLESDPSIAQQLIENKDINNKNFVIIPRALSKKPLMQKGWVCVQCESDNLNDLNDFIKQGYKSIDIIDLSAIYDIYKKNFTVLVVDCEGAFYYILQEFPEILDGIRVIIMENDYQNLDHKLYVNDILISKGFKTVYKREGGGGWAKSFFFETWSR